MWSDPIHDQTFVDGLLKDIDAEGKGQYKTFERMRGFVSVISEELQVLLGLFIFVSEIFLIFSCNFSVSVKYIYIYFFM